MDFPSCFFLGFHSGQWLGRRFHYGRRAQMRLHHCTCLKITTHPSITQGIPHPLQGRYCTLTSTVSHAISGRSYLLSINPNCLESSHFPISSIVVVVGEIVIFCSFYYLFFSVHCWGLALSLPVSPTVASPRHLRTRILRRSTTPKSRSMVFDVELEL